MGNSKVIFGNETLIDLTGDTVTPDTLLAGTTAHNRSGEQIVGTATVPEELDDLTDVTITSPAAGDLLQRNGSGKWVNSAVIPQKVAGLQKTGCVNILPNDAISKVIDGVTFTKHADGKVAINGTNGSNSVIDYPIYSGKVAVDRNTPYYLSGCPAGGSNSTYYFSANIYDGTTWKWWARETGNGLWFTPQSGDLIACTFQIQPGVTLNNVILEPMVSYAPAYYQPYSMTNRELTKAVTKRTNTSVSSQYTHSGVVRFINVNDTKIAYIDGLVNIPSRQVTSFCAIPDGDKPLTRPITTDYILLPENATVPVKIRISANSNNNTLDIFNYSSETLTDANMVISFVYV